MIKNSVIILFAALFIISCSDAPTSIGINILGNDLVDLKNINSADDSIAQGSSYFHDVVSLGSSNRLLLGKSKDIEASILISYNISLDDSILSDILEDSITVVSAVMEFYKTYSFGDTLAPFDFTVHKVNSEWASDFSEDSLSGFLYDGEDISIQKEITDTTTYVTIKNELIRDWLAVVADTSLPSQNGVYLIPTPGTEKILGYQALTSSLTDYPVISVVIEKSGVYVDTVEFYSSSDLSIVVGEVPTVSGGNIPLRSGYIVVSKLFFNLQEFPKDAVVNNAELVLNIDTLETFVGTDYSDAVDAYFLYDSTNTDSISSTVASLSRSGNQYSGNITAFVREWIRNNNNGLLLTTGSPLAGAELIAIKGSNSANLSDRPLLKITYTVKK